MLLLQGLLWLAALVLVAELDLKHAELCGADMGLHGLYKAKCACGPMLISMLVSEPAGDVHHQTLPAI